MQPPVIFLLSPEKHPTRSVNKGGFADFLGKIFAGLDIKSNIDDRSATQ
jgi:hypothetical protein